MPCLTEKQLFQYLIDSLDSTEAEQVADHVDHCPKCQSRFEEIASEPTLNSYQAAAKSSLPVEIDSDFLDRLYDVMPGETVSETHPSSKEPYETDIPESRFEKRTLIGEGSFARVYRAYDTYIRRDVALKVPKLRDDLSARQVASILEEAGKSALEHSRIVRLYDVQVNEAEPYLVQQLVDGTNLKIWISKGGYSTAEAVEMMLGICEGVEFAHENNVIHRDLKPSNILLDEELKPYIADFGLAVQLANVDRPKSEFAGTVPYMSPEQISGRINELDSRSDVWSLGVIFFEMLCGRRPFDGRDRRTLEVRITQEPPQNLLQIDAKLGQDLHDICQACLQKSKSERMQSVTELIIRLNEWRRENSDKIEIEKSELPGMLKRAGRKVIRWSIIVFLIALLIGGYFFTEQQAEKRVGRLLGASPENIWSRAQDCNELRWFTSHILQDVFTKEQSDERQRFKALIGLAFQKLVEPQHLLRGIENRKSNEVLAMVQALESYRSREAVINELHSRFEESEDQLVRCRLAILAVYLGDNELAQKLTAFDANQGDRTRFIEEYANWFGSFELVFQYLNREQPPEITSACLAGLHEVKLNELSGKVRDELRDLVEELCVGAKHAVVHSTARFLLQRWKISVQDFEFPESVENQPSWYREPNSKLVFSKIPAGSIQIEDHVHDVQSLYVSTTEVGVSNILAFFNQAPDFLKKTPYWKVLNDNNSSKDLQLPARGISWFFAYEFCNYLSRQNDYQEFYVRTDEEIRIPHPNDPKRSYNVFRYELNLDADGFRLPTEIEWRYLAAGSSKTDFFFGDSSSSELPIPKGAWENYIVQGKKPIGCGFTLPNQWGLTEVHGNQYELAHQLDSQFRWIEDKSIWNGGDYLQHVSQCAFEGGAISVDVLHDSYLLNIYTPSGIRLIRNNSSSAGKN